MKKVLLLVATECNKKAAKKIAKLLLKKKLAACVSLKEINSIYEWKGKIEEVNELEIIIKSKPELKNDLVATKSFFNSGLLFIIISNSLTSSIFPFHS